MPWSEMMFRVGIAGIIVLTTNIASDMLPEALLKVLTHMHHNPADVVIFMVLDRLILGFLKQILVRPSQNGAHLLTSTMILPLRRNIKTLSATEGLPHRRQAQVLQ
jgi:hypothetical protein